MKLMFSSWEKKKKETHQKNHKKNQNHTQGCYWQAKQASVIWQAPTDIWKISKMKDKDAKKQMRSAKSQGKMKMTAPERVEMRTKWARNERKHEHEHLVGAAS